MKQLAILGFLLLLIFPNAAQAQWKGETGFTIGVISPVYPPHTTDQYKLGVLMKMGIAKSWYNPNTIFSFRPELGINAENVSVDVDSGGPAMQVTDNGTILSINAELASLAQLRISKRFLLACGPAAKYLLFDKTYIIRQYSSIGDMTELPAEDKIYGYNRRYLNKPSVGLKAMLIRRNLNDRVNMGFAFDYQWKKAQEDYFFFSKTMELSFYLGFE